MAESDAGGEAGLCGQRFEFSKDFFGYFLSRKESNKKLIL
jgi:hypothetical protein